MQVGAASAATVAGTFGPSDSYGENGGAIIGMAPVGRVLEQALPFTVPSSDSYFLDRIEVAVGATSPQFTTMVFSLMDDSGGLPGVVLESYTFSGITTAFAGEIVSGQSSLRPTLFAGQTYWLAASAPQSELLWKIAVSGPQIPRALREDFGAWEIYDGEDWGTAYRISGTVVPEPPPSSLILVAMLLLVYMSKRARKGSTNG